MKLLIIEQDNIVRRVFAWMLAMDGWEVFSCDNRADICKLICEQQIQVILTDDHPYQTGGALKLLARIRQAGHTIPAVIVTASEYSIDKTRATTLGVTKILIKPPDIFELRAALKEAWVGAGERD